MQHNEFVFVVCGSRSHIDTLQYSLAALQKQTALPIWVVTDQSRNEVRIEGDFVIDVKTPNNLSHHQASIYLKTGLHRVLPAGKVYCYLDTDVVAVSEEVDAIFDRFKPPVTFANDHCVTDQFSPSAVKCSCETEYVTWQRELKKLFAENKELIRVPENLEKKNQLLKILRDVEKSPLRYALMSVQFNLARKIFKLNEDAFLNKKERVWHDKEGNPILYVDDLPGLVDRVESISPYRYSNETEEIWTIDGKNVFDCRCNHLKEAILKDFGVNVADEKWQHWNGGVFLFNDDGRSFLEAWHINTLKAFSLPYWKVRDQGTLIATAWQVGLQNHPKLPTRYNLLADYKHKNIEHKGSLKFKIKQVAEEVTPVFIHVYHHWGDKRWDVWQEVEKATGLSIDSNEQTINTFIWGRKPDKLDILSAKSFLQQGYRYRVWSYDNVDGAFSEEVVWADANEIMPLKDLSKDKLRQASILFRFAVLFKKGGWWVERGVTLLKPPEYGTAYWFGQDNLLSVIKAPAQSAIMGALFKRAQGLNEVSRRKIENAFREAIVQAGLNEYIQQGGINTASKATLQPFIEQESKMPDYYNFFDWGADMWKGRGFTTKGFYHKSAISALMCKFGLSQVPTSRLQEMGNAIFYSKIFNRLRSLTNG